MREKLASLLTLQTLDVKLRELEAASNKLPARLEPLRRDLAKLQGMLDTERQKLDDTGQWRRSQDRKSTRLNSSHNPASRMPSSA
jgi:predicted  nucleic acid-binding Zn-ribbon protein